MTTLTLGNPMETDDRDLSIRYGLFATVVIPHGLRRQMIYASLALDTIGYARRFHITRSYAGIPGYSEQILQLVYGARPSPELTSVSQSHPVEPVLYPFFRGINTCLEQGRAVDECRGYQNQLSAFAQLRAQPKQ